MRILIADPFPDAALTRLKAQATDVMYVPEISEANLFEKIAEHRPDVLIVHTTRVEAPTLKESPHLSLVIHVGIGSDTVDLKTASDHAIAVADCSGAKAVAAIEAGATDEVASTGPAAAEGRVEHLGLGTIPPERVAAAVPTPEQLAHEAVKIALHYRDTGKVLNPLNLCKASPAEMMLLVRHLDEPGVLASIFAILSRANINVNESENLVFTGNKAACGHIRIEGDLTDEVLYDLTRAHDALISVSVMGLK